MDIFSVILGLENISVAVLLIGISIPLLKGKIKRNRRYGFRFPQAMESDEAWIAINRYGAQRLIFWSVPLVLFGLATLVFPVGQNLPVIIATANAPLIVLIPFLESWRFAKQYDSTA